MAGARLWSAIHGLYLHVIMLLSCLVHLSIIDLRRERRWWPPQQTRVPTACDQSWDVNWRVEKYPI